jgi:hypothetical protein
VEWADVKADTPQKRSIDANFSSITERPSAGSVDGDGDGDGDSDLSEG